MFKLPREIIEGISDYRHSLQEFVKGRIAQGRFKGIRVPWGIYSHRGGGAYMVRIRVPAGVVTPAQLEALASAAEKYGNNLLHITTRQDIQIHEVKIEDTPELMEYLKSHNLSPRGGGGNTVRNIIACPLSGICSDEIFDVRGYAIALSEHLLRQETSFNMPRKFKIAFSCCEKDTAGCLINDVGFFAAHKNGKNGFKVFTGGGMGAQPRVGRLLEEFVPAEDIGYCVTAIKNIFYKKGDRRNRHHNRLRFLVEDMGFDEFIKLYKDEFGSLKKEEHIALRRAEFPERSAASSEIPKADDRAFGDFIRYSVYEQKQEGFAAAELRIPRGDISTEQLRAIAQLSKVFSGIEFRTTQNQNLIICWIEKKDIYNIFLKIKDILSDFLYPGTLLDITACKGALTCNLGLCNSPGLSKEIEALVKKEFIGKKVFGRFDIKLNGCPNACGHQPIGRLSLCGMVRKVDNRPVPFYKFSLGGRKELEKTRLAQEAGLIPAKNIPVFLKDFLYNIEKNMAQDEDVYEFLEKKGRLAADKAAGSCFYVPPYSEDKSFYTDWGKNEPFSLAGLGAGECGAGVLDMIDSDLTESKIALQASEKRDYAYDGIRNSIFLSARALLVVRGHEPRDEAEAFRYFKKEFIDTGIVSEKYSGIKEVFDGMGTASDLDERKKGFLYAKEALMHIEEVYKGMDSALNFPERGASAEEESASGEALDLKGTPCPINYVKVKLFLENLNSGDKVEVLLDEGEPMDNVPKSLEADGHKILNIEKQDGFYKVLVEKK